MNLLLSALPPKSSEMAEKDQQDGQPQDILPAVPEHRDVDATPAISNDPEIDLPVSDSHCEASNLALKYSPAERSVKDAMHKKKFRE